MRHVLGGPRTRLGAAAALSGIGLLAAVTCDRSGTDGRSDVQRAGNGSDAGGAAAACADPLLVDVGMVLSQGRATFRSDTFGSESFWGDALKLHLAIVGAYNGGVGEGVSPRTALAVGLKVDAEAIPAALAQQIQQGQVNLDDPKTTVALLKLGAVVGLKGFFDPDPSAADASLRSVGITCALCHSVVDDSFAPGIGRRLDGWANRDLNVGAIIALAPDLTPIATLLQVDIDTVRQVVTAWGPGKFDAELILDGKGFRPDGKTAATLLPAAFGLAGVSLHTWTGWGSVTHWNAFVANLDMMGKGTFYDPRLDDAQKFPVAARARFGHKRTQPDLVTAKLADLHVYQLALRAPAPPPGSYDAQAATRGKAVFEGAGRCAECHVPPIFSEPGWPMHTGAEIGVDEFQAQRSPDERYRTAPLRGLHTHMKGGFYHDGRFATLMDVIEHYDAHFSLGLQAGQKSDLVEYLKSL